ncbi:glucose/arabinose dehydrogenase [Actinomadura pelletieri DSM 43383]|uniref:Glucose/arabinose dehydrogenase n=1 Tax=Actinomadura pelletieri DSM 43383 TaxID=1120940 RepID=A0A495QQH6_9ACTN|nr:PQQ-dependent sugar dehydrogenase [Actinomadura pelletieri]RKS75102.1 glucose/arabinose dehydrogenase [Actinomadura pelletieri DSM 43383]
MRRHTIALAATAVFLAACSSDSSGGGDGGAHTPPPLTTSATSGSTAPGEPRKVADDLRVPWAMAFLPGGDALVTERDTARLVRVTPSGAKEQVGTVPGVDPGGEGGLMGVAVSPTHASDRLIYLYYTAEDDNRVVRATFDRTLTGTPQPIVTGIPKGGVHNGGRLQFGPDRMLYITTGETGETGLSQQKDSLGGKILRVTPDGKAAPGNPFGNRVWSYGHRNVQGLAWDDKGRLYATEFGQDRFDEVNLIEKGKNYGWPEVEGVGDRDGFTDPLLTWTTNEASPSGLAYAGGSLWAAALRGERLWQIPLDNGRTGRPVARLDSAYGRLRAVASAPDGTLWIATSNRDGRGEPAADDDRIFSVPVR